MAGQDTNATQDQTINLSPAWLVSTNDELRNAMKNVAELQATLLVHTRTKNENLYSTAALHRYIETIHHHEYAEEGRQTKEKQCKDILVKLTDKIDSYSRLIEDNRNAVAKEQLQLKKEYAALDEKRIRLINELLEWQTQAVAKFDIDDSIYQKAVQENKQVEQGIRSSEQYKEAEKEFVQLKKKLDEAYRKNIHDIKKNGSTNFLENSSAEYVKFLEKFSSVAELDRHNATTHLFEGCKPKLKRLPIQPILVHVPARLELEKKSITELKKIINTCSSPTIKAKANTLYEEYKKNENDEHVLFNNKPSYIATLNHNEHTQLIDDAKILDQEYVSASNALELQGETEYKELKQSIDDYITTIEDRASELDNAHVNFLHFGKSAQEFTSENMREWLKLFGELKNQHQQAVKVCDERPKATQAFLNQYQSLGKKYDAPQAEEAVSMSYRIIQAANKITDCKIEFKNPEAKIVRVSDTIAKFSNKVEEYQKNLIAEDVIQLIRVAIERNVEIWNAQISKRCGSKTLLRGLPAPRGICQLYNAIKNRSVTISGKVLISSLQKIIADRQTWSANFFGLRNMETTDPFYTVIANLNIDQLHEKTATRLKETLEKIPFKKQDGEETTLHLKVPSQSISHPIQRDNQLPTANTQPVIRRVRLVN